MKFWVRYVWIGLLCSIGAPSSYGNDYDRIKALIPEELPLADSLAWVFYLDAKAADNDEAIAKGAYLLGLTNYFQGKLYLSSKYYKEALSRDYTSGDPKLEESCWNNLGINLELQNNLSASLEAYRKSFELAKVRGDETGMAMTQINLGLLEIKAQNPDKAITYMEDALAYFVSENDTLNSSLCWQNLGLAYRSKGDIERTNAYFDRAMTYFDQALAGFTSIDHPYGIVQSLINLGYMMIRQGNTSKSVALLKEARKRALDSGFRAQEAVAIINLAKLDLDAGNYEEARTNYTAALQVFEELEIYNQWETTYWGLMNAAVREGNVERFQSLMDTFQVAIQQRISADALARYDELNTLYEVQDKIDQIESQQMQLRENRRKIIFFSILLILSITATVIIGMLLLRTRFLVQALFRKNELLLKEQGVQYQEADEPTAKIDEKLWQVFRDLDFLVDQEELYRDRNLTVSQLSKKIGSNETYVSKAIKTHTQLNFNGYINRYRLLAAQRMMHGKGEVNGVQEIGEQCGFNSHSTFVRMFKEQTGLTPSEYLRQAKSELRGDRF